MREILILPLVPLVHHQLNISLVHTHTHAVTEPISEGVLEPLINLLLSSDIDVQKSSSLAISNIALHGPREWCTCQT